MTDESQYSRQRIVVDTEGVHVLHERLKAEGGWGDSGWYVRNHLTVRWPWRRNEGS